MNSLGAMLNSVFAGSKHLFGRILFKQAPLVSYYAKKTSVTTVGLPKRPLTPYMEYIQLKFKEKPEQGVAIKRTELVKKFAIDWKSLPEVEKESYKKRYEQNVVQYQERVKEFYGTMDSDAAKKFKYEQTLARKDKRKKLHRLRTNKAKRQLDAPVKPPGAFLLFFNSLERGKTPITVFSKEAAAKWKVLPEAEKKKFNDAAHKNLEAYKEKLQAWDLKVIKDGNATLARKKTVVQVEREEKKLLPKVEKPVVEKKVTKKAKTGRKPAKVASRKKPVKKLAKRSKSKKITKTVVKKPAVKKSVKPKQKTTETA